MGGIAERKTMIDRQHPLPVQHPLPLRKQAAALDISRGSVYYLPRSVPVAALVIINQIDKLHLKYPFAGSRLMRDLLVREGRQVGRLQVATLMRRMGIEAIYRRPNT
jgi:putative transposase